MTQALTAICCLILSTSIATRCKGRQHGRQCGRQGARRLTIVGAAPLTGYHRQGAGIRPAVQLAIEDINADADVLPNYNLAVEWVDTRVC